MLENTEYRGFQYIGDPKKLFFHFFGEESPHAVLLRENEGKFNLRPRSVAVANDATELQLLCTLAELYQGGVKSQKVQRQRFDRDGRSYVDEKLLTIKIEQGWKPGTRLRFKGRAVLWRIRAVVSSWDY